MIAIIRYFQVNTIDSRSEYPRVELQVEAMLSDPGEISKVDESYLKSLVASAIENTVTVAPCSAEAGEGDARQ